ncbi:MAG: SusC/RagA family protein [Flammeovirgaceae bacterium]|nr:SusC/RagA family protein [Flammeovirgaceae bacterium]MBE61140.1 SusC/RagA family protein [Flammeovirgaceae bacterium]HCX24809.1 SusC/RagA family protein [Cytophagales bacterium]
MKKYTLLITLFLVSCSWLFAQRQISGKVISSDDQFPLPGVTILEKGTTNGTITDVEGNFTISVPEDGAILSFSFVGYQTYEVEVGSSSVIDVTLKLDLTELNEIVVIGYGQVEKEDLTGAVATVDSKDFNKGVLSSPQDLLVGRVAGVQVTTNSGAPGAGATIRIRGGSSISANNDPLIVIDGFPIDNSNVSGTSNPLASINPNDIETFTVLKDASATAIYGSRASNGVIIITTKKGQSGKPKFNYNAKVSIAQPIEYVDVLTGDEYRQLVTGLYNEGFSGINQDAVDLLGTANTDWQSEIFQTSFSHDHNLNASGTVAEIPFRVSYGYTDQQGILKTTYTKRHSFAVNLSPKFFDKSLKVNINAKQTFSETNFGDEGAVGSAVGFDPTQPIYSGNEEFGGYFAFTDADGLPITFVSNPVAMLELRNNVADLNRFIGNVQLDYTLPFFKDLSANLNLGLDKSSTDGIDDALPGMTWTYRDYTGGNGRLLDYTAENSSELLDFYLAYKKKVGVHDVQFTTGYSWQHFSREGSTYDRNGDETQVRQNTQFKNENYLISFFGRLNYVLANKYLVTATLRNDGSSRFIGDNQWGLFPSLALGWKINQEAFMSGASIVSDLKLRAGYGITGQQDVTDNQYPALPVYRESTGGASYQFGDEFVSTLRPDPYDANIKWEETTTVNVGLDFGFLKDRIYGSVEVYQRNTTDLINRIPIAGGSNFSNYLVTNVGNMENKGFEVTLSGVPISTTDFTWNAGVNITRNVNEITKLTKTDDPDYQGVAVGGISGGVGNNVQIHTVGYPANSFYVFQQVYDSNGDPIEGLYVNKSGEAGEVISNELNKYHYKSPAPDMLIGINSRANYQQFDFSFSGRFSINNYVYNNVQSGATLSGLYVSTGYFTNINAASAERGFTNPQYWSDMFIENASFFKMDNISLGYTFSNLGALEARISATVQNAFIITNYTGIDPEVSGGIDNNIYPRPRTFLLGVNLNF